MQRINRAEFEAFRRQLNGLDPNTTPMIPSDTDNPDLVFNASYSGPGMTAPGMPAAQPISSPGFTSGGAGLWSNHNTFAQYQLNSQSFNINQNYRRTALLIQNLSSADILAINFGTAASGTAGMQLQPGQGFFWDFVTPNNSVYTFFLTTTNNFGVLFEGTYGSVPV